MKQLIYIFTIMLSQVGQAQSLCAPTSPEMADYFKQKQLRSFTVSDDSGAPSIPGYLDSNNRVLIGAMSRGGTFKTQVKVDPKNSDYKDFFNYCAKGKGKYLRVMRLDGHNNRYTMSLRYLPSFKNFSNNPLVDQNYVENNVNVAIKFEDNSTISSYEMFPEKTKRALLSLIKEQVANQPEYGKIELDLSGWDDVVCDLIQGHISITIYRDGISKSPLIEQVKQVEPQDIQTAYEALRDQLPASSKKEKSIFVAGRALAQLEATQRMGHYKDNQLFDLFVSLMKPDLTAVAELDRAELNCVADRMQSYKRSSLQHIMGIKLGFPSLGELNPNLEEAE